jgi:hypothetical protein
MSTQVIISGDITATLKTGFFGGNPAITIVCRNLPVIPRTPQELVNWVAPFIDAQADPYDKP